MAGGKIRRAGRAALVLFAAIGVVSTALLAVGVAMDAAAIDRTRGGYDPPYTDFTGPPIDWSEMDTTATGMAWRGRVLNVLIDCRHGTMTFEAFGLRIPWRAFSPRALVVHRPREACQARGFAPEF